MSTEQPPVDPRSVEETKRQIRVLVNEIAAMSRRDIEPAAFYGEFLQRVITALAAVGGAVWTVRQDGGLELAYQINIRQAFPEDVQADQTQHARLLHQVLRSNEQLLVPPYSGTSGDEEAGNPTGFLLVLSPITSGDEPAGVIEIFQRPTSSPASQRGYLRFLTEMCEHVGSYLNTRKLTELSDWQNLFSRVDRFAQSVHESLDPKTTAYTIANEGRRLIGCDRVTVALNKGRRCKVEAVSGQDTMDTRSNAVMLLSKLATAVVRSGEPLWFTGDTSDLPPQIETAVHDYVDETHTKTVAVLPLFKPSDYVPDGDEAKRLKEEKEECIGALIVEQIEDSRQHDEFAQGVELVSQHSSRALSNAMDHNNLFLMPVWRALGKATWVLKAKTLPKTLAVAALVAGLIAAMFLVPYNFEMEASGKLQPKERREVFVEEKGNVVEIPEGLDHGSLVEKGQTLLVLQDVELNSRIDSTLGELQEYIKEQGVLDRQRQDRTVSGEQRVSIAQRFQGLKVKIKTLNKTLELLETQRQALTIKSPIRGQILNFQLRRNLMNRPLNRGDNVMTIANFDGEWIIDVNMPEDQMGHVAAFPPNEGENYAVKYVLKSDPENKLKGELSPSDIHDSAQLDEVDGHTVRMIVEVDEEELKRPGEDKDGEPTSEIDKELRPGAEAVVDVYCGRKPIGYVWFHKLIEFAQLNLFF